MVMLILRSANVIDSCFKRQMCTHTDNELKIKSNANLLVCKKLAFALFHSLWIMISILSSKRGGSEFMLYFGIFFQNISVQKMVSCKDTVVIQWSTKLLRR